MIEFNQQDNTAVIVVDMQYDCVEPSGLIPAHGAEEIVDGIDNFLKVSRQNNIPIIYTQHIHRRDLSDFGIAHYFEPPSCYEGSRGAEIIEELKPKAEDIVLTKTRYDAFMGTELDLILRQKEVKNLIVCGVLTDGCVLGSVVHARGLDYKVCLVEDLLRGTSTEKHEAALKVMETYFAKISDVEQTKKIFGL